MTVTDRDAAELTQRLADAVRDAEAARIRLEEAQAAVRILERDLAAANAVAEQRVAERARAEASQAPDVVALPAPAPAPVAVEPEAPAADPPAAAAKPELTEAERELHARLDYQRAKLNKRGFRRDDLYYHQCATCSEQAVEKYHLVGKPGGRDIDLCLGCGEARSWRRRPEKEDRELDPTFDIVAFLG